MLDEGVYCRSNVPKLPLDESIAGILSKVLIAAGVLLNLWTFQVLGIKGAC